MKFSLKKFDKFSKQNETFNITHDYDNANVGNIADYEEDNYNSMNNVQTLPKQFSVVRIMTENGEKIGMCYSEDVCCYGLPIVSNLDFNNACNAVKQCCTEFGLSEYKNNVDKIVGIIPEYMIPKKSKKTSYTY